MQSLRRPAQITVLATIMVAAVGAISAQEIQRISLTFEDQQANGASRVPAVNGDGSAVVFESDASNLIAGDWNSFTDIYYRDLALGETYRVTVAFGGGDPDSTSHTPDISTDASLVVFSSYATNLIEEDVNEVPDIFALDTGSGTISRVSVATGEDLAGNGASTDPVVNDNGNYVAFLSIADNLVGSDTNEAWDVFVRYRQVNQTVRASVATDGSQADGDSGPPDLSANGFQVAFASLATNLVAGDTNGVSDIFVRDLASARTTRVSSNSDGLQANGDCARPSISGDGRYIVFESAATNLVAGDTNDQVDIFLHDVQTGETTRMNLASDGSQADAGSCCATISSDGRLVVFTSEATNLVAGDTNGVADIFLHDRIGETTVRISRPDPGSEADAASAAAAMDADGSFVAFESSAANLVPDDDNQRSDVFATSFGFGFRPVPAFQFSPENPVVDEMVAFTDLTINEPTWWEWTFGDGSFSFERNPTHTYTESGSYGVTLTVGNANGAAHLSRSITVLPPGSAFRNRYLLPAAARASGAEGAFFVTDLDIKNAGATEATYRAVWLRRGTPQDEPPASAEFTLAAGAAVRYHDAVAALFGLTARSLGAIRIESDSADLRIVGRIANVLQDGSTFGQSLPGLGPDDLIEADEVRQILFLTQDDAYRSNLGLANASDVTVGVEIRYVLPDGTVFAAGRVDLAPWANVQLNEVFADAAPVEAASAIVWSETPGAAFAAYGSVLDNVTSDPTTVMPQ
jgi:PKD repeat protein/Tol biopolymer transport system component